MLIEQNPPLDNEIFLDLHRDSGIRAGVRWKDALRQASRSAFYTATTTLNTTRVIIPAPAPVHSVAVGPDGHTLASVGADHTVRLWATPLDATPFDATVATLCSKLTSNISHQDWSDWISPTIGYITLCPDLPIATDKPAGHWTW